MNDEPENTEDENVDDDWAAAMAEQADAEGGDTEQPEVTPEAAKAVLEDLDDSDVEPGQVDEVKPNLDVVLDIPVTITMEVGRTEISIRNLLQLNQGSVVELDRLAGEPLDVMINGTIVAHGEVVVVNDKYGIRMTDVVSPADRIKRIQ